MHRSHISNGKRTAFPSWLGGWHKDFAVQRQYEFLKRTYNPPKYLAEKNARWLNNNFSAICSGARQIVETMSIRKTLYDNDSRWEKDGDGVYPV